MKRHLLSRREGAAPNPPNDHSHGGWNLAARRRYVPGWLTLVAIVACCGCPSKEEPAQPVADAASAASRPSVALQVAVVNDAPLGEAIERLRGEWGVLSGGTFSASPVDWESLQGSDPPEADIIIFPERYLGELCERGWLRPVRDNVLESEDLDADDYFPLVRQQVMTYGGKVMALPLGIDLPVIAFRRDAFTEGGRPIPASWEEYAKLGAQSPPVHREPRAEGDSEGGLPQGAPSTWEPIDTWPGFLLLMRAASYGVDGDRLDLFFDLQTMKPRIADPPFVRALEELRRDVGQQPRSIEASGDETPPAGPRDASARVAAGSLAAIGLPPAPAQDGSIAGATVDVGWALVPGARETFSAASGSWQVNPSPRVVPLLGVGGRLGAVTTSSRNGASAFRLLGWLASPEISSQFARAGMGTMPVRRSLAAAPAWYPREFQSQQRSELGELLKASLARNEYLSVPRIIAIDSYLEVLDRAVEDALSDRKTPEGALADVGKEWETLTETIGRDRQRKAYLDHLGLEP